MRGVLTIAGIRSTDALTLHHQVSLRPEPFGALAYHFGNRRLTFLRSPQIVTVVETLAEHETVADALSAADIDRDRWPNFLSALDTLATSEVICAR